MKKIKFEELIFNGSIWQLNKRQADFKNVIALDRCKIQSNHFMLKMADGKLFQISDNFKIEEE